MHATIANASAWCRVNGSFASYQPPLRATGIGVFCRARSPHEPRAHTGQPNGLPVSRGQPHLGRDRSGVTVLLDVVHLVAHFQLLELTAREAVAVEVELAAEVV